MKLPNKYKAGKFTIEPNSIVISLNKTDPEVGSFASRVYDHDGQTSCVFWGDQYLKNVLNPSEQKTLEKLVQKLLRKSKASAQVKITYTKRKGFDWTPMRRNDGRRKASSPKKS